MEVPTWLQYKVSRFIQKQPFLPKSKRARRDNIADDRKRHVYEVALSLPSALRNDIVGHLLGGEFQACSFFQDLGEGQCEEVVWMTGALVRRKNFEPEVVIYAEGEHPSGIYLLMQGQVGFLR